MYQSNPFFFQGTFSKDTDKAFLQKGDTVTLTCEKVEIHITVCT